VTDPRPTQAEVEAKADEMFGEGWKQPMEEAKQDADAVIAALLDEARAEVEATR
jgi:hypothetical protein